MLQSDRFRLDIIKLLKKNGPLSLGQLKKATKVGHFYTLTAALDFLKELGFVEIINTEDKRGTRIVKLK